MVKLEVINSQPFLKINNKDTITNRTLVRKNEELLVVSLEEDRVDLFSFEGTTDNLKDIKDVLTYEEISEEIENGKIEIVNREYAETQKKLQRHFKYSN